MTVQEAIQAIRLDGLTIDGSVKRIKQFVNGLAEATELLEEVEQYRALGTVEELKEAKEKQTPKKFIRQKGECYGITKDGKQYHEIFLLCPNCHRAIKRTEALDVHCKYCGQKIDWEEGAE